MIRSSGFALLLLLLVPPAASAQPTTFDLSKTNALVPTPGILGNSVSNLHAEGDTLWAGPFLSVTDDGGQTWRAATADSLSLDASRVFSIDIEGDVIWVGLGFSSVKPEGTFQAAGGFLVSTDGGETFTYRFPPLDAAEDTTEPYGVNTLEALAILVPEQSPPFDIDYDPVGDVVYTAGWASGLRRSTDGGRTWDRVVLPPDDLTAIRPDEAYDFVVAPRRGGEGHFGHMAFAVLVDETGTLWAGTPVGVVRSTDGAAWERFGYDGTPNSPTGSWIISIEEQPLAGRNPVWLASWDAGPEAETSDGSRFGITVTRDGGATFEQVLIGETVYDFAFRGQTVYAASASGLLISDDGGRIWRTVRDFFDPSQPDQIVRPGAEVFAVATTPDALWVGTEDGLLKSTDGGATWTLFRAFVPLDPDDAPPILDRDLVPEVETFAYPNPFSPVSDRIVRIRYDLDGGSDVRVRIFDFGMHLVRDLADASQPAGAREATWDGTDDDGVRVANGVYLYAVETDDGTFWGKILLLE